MLRKRMASKVVCWVVCNSGLDGMSSGQISSRPHTSFYPKWWLSKGNPRLFQGNLGWWNIIIWPDVMKILWQVAFLTQPIPANLTINFFRDYIYLIGKIRFNFNSWSFVWVSFSFLLPKVTSSWWFQRVLLFHSKLDKHIFSNGLLTQKASNQRFLYAVKYFTPTSFLQWRLHWLTSPSFLHRCHSM